ncbi:NAD-dependent deacylase [bacterium]|nr:NAD-dependent deacylase [bacterium]
MFSNRLIETIKSARKIAVLTGAGISAESGVPTFRGEEGLWKKFRPEELANFEAFMRNPELVWEWYNYRRKLISEVQPNPGHVALAEMEACVDSYWLITQNVDGLHRRAGNRHILELHGNIMRSRCITCGQKEETLDMFEKGELPRCTCGGIMRPDVVWFGEMLPSDILNQAFQAAEACDLFFSIGTSAVVHPAASLPITALNQGAFVIEINIEPTVISGKLHESIIGKSGEVLPQLLKDIWGIDIECR